MPDFQYRVALAGEAESIRDHFNAAFLGQRSAAVQEWKFRAKPWSDPAAPIGVIATLEDRVVGFYGSLPWQLTINGHVIDVLQACDVSVAAEFRDQGILAEMFSRYITARTLFGRLGFGFPSAEASAEGLTRFGHTVKCEARAYRRSAGPYAGLEDGVELSGVVPADWFPFAHDVASGYGITTYRSLAFMNWRYQSPGRVFGFLTLRETSGAVRGVLAFEERGDAVRVYDWLAADPAAFGSMFSRLTALHPELPILHGCTSTAPYLDRLAEMGFELVGAGRLVAQKLSEAGVLVADSLGDDALERADWFCTLTDTDL
jgi:hypothetical protein